MARCAALILGGSIHQWRALRVPLAVVLRPLRARTFDHPASEFPQARWEMFKQSLSTQWPACSLPRSLSGTEPGPCPGVTGLGPAAADMVIIIIYLFRSGVALPP